MSNRFNIPARDDALVTEVIASLQHEHRFNTFRGLLAVMAHIRKEVDLYGRPLWLVRLRPKGHEPSGPVYSVRVRLDPWPPEVEPLLEVLPRPPGDRP